VCFVLCFVPDERAVGLGRGRGVHTDNQEFVDVYRCQKCDEVVGEGRKVRRVVVETRPKTYVQRKVIGKAKRKTDDPPIQVTTSTGWETVRTMRVCGTCEQALMERFQGVPPSDRRGVSATG
jgi:hypothetical protein